MAHSAKSLERNISGFIGIAPVHETLVGMAARLGEAESRKIMPKMRALGRRGG